MPSRPDIRHLVRILVQATLLVATLVTVARAAPAAVKPLELELAAMFYGARVTEYHEVVDSGDVNGDGAADMLTRHYVRPDSPTEEIWYELVMGRPSWPAQADRQSLGQVYAIDFPQRRGLVFPDEPDFQPEGIADINDDGYDDLLILRVDRKGAYISQQVSVYFGHDDPWADLDVESTEPELFIRQPRLGQGPTGDQLVPKPDAFGHGDLDGDGDTDLFVFACDLRGKASRLGGEGAMLVYLTGDAGLRSIDMLADDPDAVLYGAKGNRVGCNGHSVSEDYNGDGREDLGITVNDYNRNREITHLLLSPATWPAEAELADLAAATIIHPRRNEDVWDPDFHADLTGDGLPEFLVQSSDATARKGEFFFYSDHPWPGTVAPEDADLQLLEVLMVAGDPGDRAIGQDLNGDGLADLVMRVDQPPTSRATEWRIALGPEVYRGAIRPKLQTDWGDYTYSLEWAEQGAKPEWWPGDFDGDGRSDVAISNFTESSPDRVRDAGVTRLYLGPLVEPVGPTATSVPSPTVTLEATPTTPPSETPSISPTPSATPSETRAASATRTPDLVSTHVASTLTALAPSPTPEASRTPTPDLVQTAVAATLTAMAPSPTPGDEIYLPMALRSASLEIEALR